MLYVFYAPCHVHGFEALAAIVAESIDSAILKFQDYGFPSLSRVYVAECNHFDSKLLLTTTLVERATN